MTMMDLGPERPGPASSTRQMVEADRALGADRFSGRAFWIGLAVTVAAIGALVLLLR